MKTQIMLFVSLCFVVTMFLLLLNSVEAADDVRCRENERRALLEFKAGIVDDHGMLSSWGNTSEEECCHWRGISCSNLTGHVTILNLSSGYYDIDFIHARLRGKISPSLSELKHLKHLNLSFNSLNGDVPPQLGNLSNLLSLDLDRNYGLKVQNLDWLSNLRSLTRLHLSAINLRSCYGWLNQIYKLSSLTHLELAGCHLPDQSGPPLPLINTSFSASNSLAVVDLSFNNFNSPNSYNWLLNFTTALVYLDLSENSFLSSGIPEALGRFISLESLYLHNCEIEGTLPDSFRNLSRLGTLKLEYNNFNGSLSEFLLPLATKEKNLLQVLVLDFNQLHGSLPDFFSRFPYLREISIFRNKLSGSFPNNFLQVSSGLIHLDLSYNQITGQLPNITLLSSLETLTLGYNKLEGAIPETYFSNLSKLNVLDLSSNSLSLKFSVYWVAPFQLSELLLHNCTLGPHFPNWLQSQRKISLLSIPSAGISDTIPPWFWDLLSTVSYLNISHNNLQGTLPNLSLPNSFGGGYIDMSSNNLTGLLPRLPVDIHSLDLSKNMFTGSLSFLCTTSYKNFISIRLSDNQLSGELPDCWINVKDLLELNLANNNFSGKLPPSIGILSELQVLQLRNNSLSGELPLSLMSCSELRLLDLSENELSGEVPAWIGTHLKFLLIFSLSRNKLFGRIPPQLCLLGNVQVVDLSRNNLSRSIPNCVNNFSSLAQREDFNFSKYYFSALEAYGDNRFTIVANAYVQWKGQNSLYRHTLGLLKLIDFSSNRLVGEIPEEFGSLKGLMSLNLSRNSLNGNIIPNIGQMNNLEVLDLSENNLSGEIPASLSNLTFLSVLDLAKNKLTGRIPSSTQLQSFDPSSYAGNDKLCGLPLPDKCPNDETNVFSLPGAHGYDEEYEDKFVTIWFYISLVLGFIAGFWGFLGPVMLRSTWRHSYSMFLEKITDCIYVTA